MNTDAGVTPFVGELQRAEREEHGDDGLPGDLGLAAQAERALLADLDEVVQKPTTPNPVNRNRISSAEADGGSG